MTDGLTIVVALEGRNGKVTDWEFTCLPSPLGPKWHGRVVGDENPPKVLTGRRLIKAKEAYTLHLETLVAESPAPTKIVQPEPLESILDGIEEHESAIGGESEPLSDDITKETIIEPVMYDESVLGPKPRWRVLQRHHVGDARYYVVQFEENGRWSRPELYTGVTSVVKSVLPMPRELLEWWCGFGSYDAAWKELNDLAAKGTVMHSLFAEAIMGTLPDFGTSEFERHVRRHISNQGIDPNAVIGEWLGFFQKALLGFKQFCFDMRVKFLAVEIVLGQPHERGLNGEKLHGYFAQLDFILEMDKKHYEDGFIKGRRSKMPDKPKNGRRPSKGFDTRRPFVSVLGASTDWSWSDGNCGTWEREHVEYPAAVKLEASPCDDLEIKAGSLREWEFVQQWTQYPDAMLPEERERVIAIVDAKSGKNDFPEHDLQLNLQIPLVKLAFPHLDISNIRVYNWHPTDWRESSVSEKSKGGGETRFGYSLIDKTNRMDERRANRVLDMWRNEVAKDLPTKAIYQGSPNIGVHPSENIRFADYPTYWEEKVARAIHHKFIEED